LARNPAPTAYSYQVQAVNAAGVSTFSNVMSHGTR
jgi:hypothetical protein